MSSHRNKHKTRLCVDWLTINIVARGLQDPNPVVLLGKVTPCSPMHCSWWHYNHNFCRQWESAVLILFSFPENFPFRPFFFHQQSSSHPLKPSPGVTCAMQPFLAPPRQVISVQATVGAVTSMHRGICVHYLTPFPRTWGPKGPGWHRFDKCWLNDSKEEGGLYILMKKKSKVKETECGLNNGCDRSTWKGPLCYSWGRSWTGSGSQYRTHTKTSVD